MLLTLYHCGIKKLNQNSEWIYHKQENHRMLHLTSRKSTPLDLTLTTTAVEELLRETC